MAGRPRKEINQIEFEKLCGLQCTKEEIWDFIKNGYAKERHTGNNQIGQAAFYYIGWNEFKKRGYNIKIYQKCAQKNEV